MASAPDVEAAILVYGDRRLRQRARPVAPGEDLGDLPARLLTTMDRAAGIGLAAPQVGDLRRVIAVRDPEIRPPRTLVMVNPEIVAHTDDAVPFEEGCLSFPDLYLTLLRPRGVEARYRDVTGHVRRLRAEGTLARVVQHEVDHLDGILFVDHLPRWRRWLLASRLRRLRRRTGRAAARRELA